MARNSTMTAYLNADTRQFQSKMDTVTSKLNSVGNSMKKLGGVMAGAFAVNSLVSYGREFSEMAGKLEGVQAAFKRLNRPDLLNNLKTATLGTVNNLKLMQAAVKANNFKVPLDKLASFFEFATKRSAQTGESVDYLVESIVNGIGRKSTLVLDNLGISAAELQAEVKKVGDFGLAAGNIIERELSKAGDVVKTSAQRTASWNASAENLQLRVGGLINNGLNLIAPIVDKITNGLITGFDQAGRQVNHFTNRIIDLYNESARLRLASVAINNSMKFAFDTMLLGIESVALPLKNLIASFADFAQGKWRSAARNVQEVFTETAAAFKKFGQKAADNFKEGIDDVVGRNPIEYVGLGESNVSAMANQAQTVGQNIGENISTGIERAFLDKNGADLLAGYFAGKNQRVNGFNLDVGFVMPEEGTSVFTSMKERLNINTIAYELLMQTIQTSLSQGKEGLKNFHKNLANAAKSIVGSFIQIFVASSIVNLFDGSNENVLSFVSPIAKLLGNKAKGLFDEAIPEFSKGALVYGPTVALVGDNPRAYADPEIITPLSKLDQMTDEIILVGDVGVKNGEIRADIELLNS